MMYYNGNENNYYNQYENGYNEAPEADLSFKEVGDFFKKHVVDKLADAACKIALNTIRHIPGTTVVIYNDENYVKLMYRVVDNSAPYNEFNKNRKKIQASVEMDYTPSPSNIFYRK